MTGWKHDLVTATDYSLNRLRARVAGLSDDEYLWEPAPGCWTIRPDEHGEWHGDWTVPIWPAPLTTIAWRLGHIINNLFDPRYATHLGLEPRQPPPSSLPSTAAAALETLDEGCAVTLAHLQAIDESALAEPLGPIAGPWAEDDRASFVLHIVDELTHHGAEVGVLRDLYRAMQPPNPLVDRLLEGDADGSAALVAGDPHLLDRARSERADLLLQAAAERRWDALPVLIEHGFALALPDGSSALHHAASAGAADAVRTLRAAGADLALRDPIYRATPAAWATYFDQPTIADELREVSRSSGAR
jgi:hypothetical protein